MIYRNFLSILIIFSKRFATAAGAGEDAQAQAQAALRFASIEIKKDHLQHQRDESRKLRSLEKRARARTKGKESKPDPFCDVPAIQCGQTFTNEKVVLTGDLTCTDDVNDATEQVLSTLNAAITLVGPDAVIDCKGHTVRQFSSGSAASCDKNPGRKRLNRSDRRKDMKLNCQIYFQVGIWLKDGATAKNCEAEQFYDGFLILNGGKVENSEAHWNKVGIFVQVRGDNDNGVTSEVSEVKTSLNSAGLSVLSLGTGAEVSIDKVTSEYNSQYGYRLRGRIIRVKDSIANNNYEGIRISGETQSSPTNVQFEGEVSSYGNTGEGIVIGEGLGEGFPSTGYYAFSKVIVKGNLKSFRNKDYGLLLEDFQSQGSEDFVVEKNGSFFSCQNGFDDIYHEDAVIFVDENPDGGYTCDSPGTTGTSLCAPCPVCA